MPAAGYDAADDGGQEMGDTQSVAVKASLYDRLGGVYSIATVIDDFIDRIMVDPKAKREPLCR